MAHKRIPEAKFRRGDFCRVAYNGNTVKIKGRDYSFRHQCWEYLSEAGLWYEEHKLQPLDDEINEISRKKVVEPIIQHLQNNARFRAIQGGYYTDINALIQSLKNYMATGHI